MKALLPKLLAPGRLLALPLDEDTSVLLTGASVGWFASDGLRAWTRELSVIDRRDVTQELRARLGLTLPEEQIAIGRVPLTHEAASTATWLAVTSAIAPALRASNVRVYTVGADKLTSRFVYEARGAGPDVVFECDMVEFASAVSGDLARNEVLSRALVTGLDRLVRALSGGRFGEHDLLLAERLPRLSSDGTGLADVQVERFEEDAARAQASLSGFGSDVAELALVIGQAAGAASSRAPLFGTAEKRVEPAKSLTLGGQRVDLKEHSFWVVSGEPSRDRTVDTKSSTMPLSPFGAGAAVAAEELDHLRRVVSAAPPAGTSPMEVSAALEDAVREAASDTPVALAESAAPLEAPAALVPSPPLANAKTDLPSVPSKSSAQSSEAPLVQDDSQPLPHAPSHAPKAAEDDTEPGQGLWFVLLLIGVAYFIWHGR